MRESFEIPQDSHERRSSAEARVPASLGPPAPSGQDPRRLIHELQVHQVELQLQNGELRRARAEREEMEALLGKYSELYDFAPVGYFNLDRDGIVRAANLTGIGLLRSERSKVINRRLDQFISEKTRPLFHDFLGRVFSSQFKQTCEIEFLDDAQAPLHMQLEAIASGSRRECRAVACDITDRKQVEEALLTAETQLFDLNDQLELRISERTKELAGTVESLREEIAERLRVLESLHLKERMLIQQNRQAAIGEMISNIAHQWRQPLNIIGLSIQELKMSYDYGECSPDLMSQKVGRSMQLIQQMSQTIDDFSLYFKPEQEKTAFRLSDVIDSTVSLIKDSFKHRQVSIDVIARDAPVIVGFSNELVQSLLSILNNARDALIEREIEHPLVTITSCSENGRAVVTIADNAGGIAEQVMGKIFDPYFTTKGEQTGTGLGLFMAKTIVENNLGGRLTVRNVDNGAEFRIEV